MILLLVIILVILAIVWIISTRNNFKRKELKVDESLSGIEVALTKRYDMLTKMMDVAKGYAKHEKEVFAQVVELRKDMSVAELNEASRKMDAIMDTIRVTAEAYPDLRSSQVFSELQQGIYDSEEHLQAARRLYNSNVNDYNTSIAMFPAKLLAGGYKKKDFFKADEYKKQDVSISL